ncbi:MAG: type II secretion system protein [Planctomycetota bacterium]|nr:MAG: type II secretion system protein [Planctomycetota bacterium]
MKPLVQRKSGFTLVEILVVVAIIGILLTILIAAIGGMRRKAKIEATKGLISRVVSAIEEYKKKWGNYPPDGLDYTVQDKNGTAVKNTSALRYLLCFEHQMITYVGSGADREKRSFRVSAFLSDLKKSELTDPSDTGLRWQKSTCEFRDPWGQPLEYDNMEHEGIDSSELPPQANLQSDFNAPHHMIAKYDSKHPTPKDPRPQKALNDDAYAYFLWSHGPKGKKRPIGNWNLKIK